jgi:hypothetical protein
MPVLCSYTRRHPGRVVLTHWLQANMTSFYSYVVSLILFLKVASNCGSVPGTVSPHSQQTYTSMHLGRQSVSLASAFAPKH